MNDVLAQIPQVSTFFNTTPTATNNLGTPTITPNIRNLGGSGAATTLLLQNGHRLVGVGIVRTSADPSSIPAAALDRVEVVPDGGSSIYGSDAVGGVINFITRKRFNGLQLSGSYGFADDYRVYNIGGIAGKDWGTGSLYVAYEHSWHDNIRTIDRDFIRSDFTSTGGIDNRIRQCATGNVTANGASYRLPDFTPGANLCSRNDYDDFYPREKRDSVFAYMTQDLTDSLSIGIETFWSRRVTSPELQQLAQSVTMTPANPYFRSIAGETNQQVDFNYTPVFGLTRDSEARTNVWGVVPTVVADLGSSWQLRAEGNYSRGFTGLFEAQIDPNAQAAALAATSTTTALNPYNLGATNPAVLDAIRAYEIYGRSTQELISGRLNVQGTLFTLPGGDVRLAVGGEHQRENFSAAYGSGPSATVRDTAVRVSTGRNVSSAFGELVIPLFGQPNARAGLERLELSASVRYDDYSDFGSTTNPKVGLTYSPVKGLVLRGNYGASFNAPSLADTTGAVDTRAIILPLSPFVTAGATQADRDRRTILIAGGNPGLKPQTAKTFSIGGDLRPAVVPGLQLSLTYYNVHFKNSIRIIPFDSSLFEVGSFSRFYIINPTLEQYRAQFADLPVELAPSIESIYANGQSPYILLDARRNNMGQTKTDGLDFAIDYSRQTSFGSFGANLAGTYVLNRKSRPGVGAPEVDELGAFVSRLSLVASLGASVGPLTGRIQAIRSGGFDVSGVPHQDRVKAFTTTNLFFSLDLSKVSSSNWLDNTQLTLNVDNVFDVDPPFYNAFPGYSNGSTLGRLVRFGVRTKF